MCELARTRKEYQWMMEEDRRAAVLAAADAARLADRGGGDVWRAATQLDFALLALGTTAPHTCFTRNQPGVRRPKVIDSMCL